MSSQKHLSKHMGSCFYNMANVVSTMAPMFMFQDKHWSHCWLCRCWSYNYLYSKNIIYRDIYWNLRKTKNIPLPLTFNLQGHCPLIESQDFSWLVVPDALQLHGWQPFIESIPKYSDRHWLHFPGDVFALHSQCPVTLLEIKIIVWFPLEIVRIRELINLKHYLPKWDKII